MNRNIPVRNPARAELSQQVSSGLLVLLLAAACLQDQVRMPSIA